MRTKLAAVFVFAAALVGCWFYFRSRTIDVWLYTDYAFRFKHADWPALVDARFQEVNRIYRRDGTGVRWKVLDASQTDPTSDIPGLDNRRANMVFHQDRKTDVYVILTGVREGDRTGSVSPFTNVAVVVDMPEKSETVNARLMAHELAHLFGAPHDPALRDSLMSEKPESANFAPRTAALIARMRSYPFAMGIDGLSQGSWEKKALAAVAEDDSGTHISALAHAHTVIGTSLLNERKKDLALAHFKVAVEADPKNVTLRLNLAEAYTRDGQDELALEQARSVVRLAPGNPLSHRALGALLGRTHQTEEAVQELQIAARMDPKSADTQVLLGMQLAAMYGRLDDAIAAFDAAARINPDSTTAQEALLKSRDLKDRLAEEITAQRDAVRRDPKDADAHYRLAKAEARAGDLAGAIRDFQKSAGLRPNYGMPHAELAELYLTQGDIANAWGEVRKARALGTEPPAILMSRLPPEK